MASNPSISIENSDGVQRLESVFCELSQRNNFGELGHFLVILLMEEVRLTS